MNVFDAGHVGRYAYRMVAASIVGKSEGRPSTMLVQLGVVGRNVVSRENTCAQNDQRLQIVQGNSDGNRNERVGTTRPDVRDKSLDRVYN